MQTEEQPANKPNNELWEKARQSGLTRRTFLALLAVGGAAAVLTACTKAATNSTPIPSSTVPKPTSSVPSKSSAPVSISPTSSAVPATVGSKPFPGTAILGRPTADAITISLLTSNGSEAYVEYGKTTGNYSSRTDIINLQKDQPAELDIAKLSPDTLYYYRVCHRAAGETGFSTGAEATLRTQRAPGSTFSFGVQGDSHPERTTSMFNADLYMLTLNTVNSYKPDFYVMIGDDFRIDTAEFQDKPSLQAVEKVYLTQRNWLGSLAGTAPLFLVNGNHEFAAKTNLDGTANNLGVFAGKTRTKFFPLPAPNAFYSGNAQPVDHIGLLRDYYAWTWGDALFVVIDFYWHSDVPISGSGGNINMWEVTLGETQYQWFKQALEQSKAKYKFVFTHHVLAVGRGGIEMAAGYEWGGQNKDGTPGFEKNRPGWGTPIHQLMVKNNVTIFFQGHDHLYCRQELDGVVYQSIPNPADYSYTAFNKDAYKTGVTLPNSGFLNVTVSPPAVKVDYISSYLPKDETTERKNGKVAYSYTIKK